MAIPESSIQWTPSFRIIADRYPAINFFERISADPADWEILLEIEKMTDPSLKVGDISLLEEPDRISGPGSGLVLPSFTFLNPQGSRFSTSNFGAYYAAFDLKTAIAETVYHRTKFMLSTNEPPQELDQLLILADVSGLMHDIRNLKSTIPEVYSTSSYSKSQALAEELRSNGSLGIVYKSVRRTDGECVAAWRARVISNAREDTHITYCWDGKKISGYYFKGKYEPLS